MTKGPVPKRSEERIRRNKVDVEKVEQIGSVPAPELDFPFCADVVQDFYDSLRSSAQAKYYEPSDWQTARLLCRMLQSLFESKRPSPQMFQSCVSLMNELLVTEGSRRRVRMEVERHDAEAEVFDIAEVLRQRQQAG